MKRIAGLLVFLLLFPFVLGGCSGSTSGLQNGYYTAEAAEYDEYGWKEFVTLYAKDGRVVTMEYNAKNASGFIKSWDMDYMRVMNADCGTYPNEYTRQYAAEFLETQNSHEVDMIAGATQSYYTFVQLADAALERALAGDTTVALVAFEPVAE